ncbi:MAG: hypothetical protein JXR83_18360, partial [Deltaproteobacteria bacterium]|nr:hypothetical protein [Deltaproteobacteria bacterium]
MAASALYLRSPRVAIFATHLQTRTRRTNYRQVEPAISHIFFAPQRPISNLLKYELESIGRGAYRQHAMRLLCAT